MWKHSPDVRCCLAVVAVLAASSISAQNLVTNPDLASGLSPWTQEASTAPDPAASGQASWTGGVNDDNLTDGTGSARVQLVGQLEQPANAAFGIRQCISLPAAPVNVDSADYGIHFLAPATGNPGDGMADAVVEVRFFLDAACTVFITGAGGSQGYRMAPGALSDTLWHEVGDMNFSLPRRLAVRSAEIRAFLRLAGSTNNGYEAYFDHAWLRLNTIFADGFESGSTSAWSSAAAKSVDDHP